MNRTSRTIFGVVLAAGMCVAGTAGSAMAAPRHDIGTTYYLALGDSVGAGYQNPAIPTDRGCTSTTLDLQGQRGYTCILFDRMHAVNPNLQFTSLALAVSPGEDSCSFSNSTQCEGGPNAGRTDAGLGDTAPFDFTTTTQLQAAEAFIENHDVSVISLNLGGNDFLPLLGLAQLSDCSDLQAIPSFAIWYAYDNANCIAAATNILTNVVGPDLATNLGTIAGTLRAIDPTATILVGDQYDPLDQLPSGALNNGAAIEAIATGALGPGTISAPGFQSAVQQIAAATSTTWVDEYDTITNGVTETWITSNNNIHPNAIGYNLLANQYWATYVKSTTGESISVKGPSKAVKAGKKATLAIKTLPASSVATTITYKKGGKTKTVKLSTVRLGTVATSRAQLWKTPFGVKKANYSSCSSLGSGTEASSKCATGKFIIAS
jgi:lysophospholipase L1-like esterase